MLGNHTSATAREGIKMGFLPVRKVGQFTVAATRRIKQIYEEVKQVAVKEQVCASIALLEHHMQNGSHKAMDYHAVW